MPTKSKERNNRLGRYQSGGIALAANGWKSTPNGRWTDPQTNKSHTAMEAWQIINTRGR